MLLAIFFIIGTAIFRGLLNYLIMNAILSIGSINYVRMIESCRIIYFDRYILRFNVAVISVLSINLAINDVKSLHI